MLGLVIYMRARDFLREMLRQNMSILEKASKYYQNVALGFKLG
jgi:hypothetical protein